MKPICEKVIPSSNNSWRFVKYQLNYIEFNWHYHPEYEICLTINSKGLRYVGDHIESYGDCDLVLLGPDLPHTWHSKLNSDNSDQIVYVAQIPKRWIEGLVNEQPELLSLSATLNESRRGIKFSTDVAKKALTLFQKIEQAEPFTRFHLLMCLLDLMRHDDDTEILSSSRYHSELKQEAEEDKLDTVIKHIYKHFKEPLNATDLARLAHMSTNYFHRFFKRRTERTLTEFINQLRIGHACKLLINTNFPVATISDQCGFGNISNFNRRFLQFKGLTPSQYRKTVKAPEVIF